MPAAIPNGGGGSDVTTSQAAAYKAAISKPQGEQTAQDQQAIAEAVLHTEQAAAGWVDSGGVGGRQAAAALRVLEELGGLELNRVQSVNQYAKEAASDTVKARRAQLEMHGADTEFLGRVLRVLFELEARVNDAGIP